MQPILYSAVVVHINLFTSILIDGMRRGHEGIGENGSNGAAVERPERVHPPPRVHLPPLHGVPRRRRRHRAQRAAPLQIDENEAQEVLHCERENQIIR